MKIVSRKVAGWGLVATFLALAILILAGTPWQGPVTVAASLSLVLILAGLLLLPAIMVLRRRWHELAAVISGFSCLVLFFLLQPRVTDLTIYLSRRWENQSWAPFLCLILLISAWVLPFKLHAFLKPRLHRLLAGEKYPAERS